MTKNRKDIVNLPHEVSLLDLPLDILRFPNDEAKSISITSVGSENDTKIVLQKLSNTCETLHTFFKPTLESLKTRHAAKKLLDCLLNGTKKDTAKVIAEAKMHPQLFFIKVTTYSPAMDLEGNRRLMKEWSPFQALFLDHPMLELVRPELDAYLHKLKDGYKIAKEQIEEKFPDGFDFPESTYDFSILSAAIAQDERLLLTDKPNLTTLAALKQFRKDFKPGVVTMGHPFNMNDLIKAYKTYDTNILQRWEPAHLRFFGKCVIGFLERFMTGFYLMSVCQGIKYLQNGQPFERTVEVKDYIHEDEVVVVNGERKNLLVRPIDLDPSCRLGAEDGFAIDSNWRGVWALDG